jgi:hypothetical protein
MEHHFLSRIDSIDYVIGRSLRRIGDIEIITVRAIPSLDGRLKAYCHGTSSPIIML